MDKVLSILREEFGIDAVQVSFAGPTDEFITMNGSNSSITLNCYYEKKPI
jgi:hypothetical protein